MGQSAEGIDGDERERGQARQEVETGAGKEVTVGMEEADKDLQSSSERAGTSPAILEEIAADTQVLLVTWQLVNIVHGIMGLSFDYSYKPWHGILFYLVCLPSFRSTR
jgi:hypothetical protein